MVKDGEELPRAVTLLCGQYGIRHADVAEWRIGEDAVTVLTKRGQKYMASLVRLVDPPQFPPLTGGRRRRDKTPLNPPVDGGKRGQ